jgi:hypothetical protein
MIVKIKSNGSADKSLQALIPNRDSGSSLRDPDAAYRDSRQRHDGNLCKHNKIAEIRVNKLAANLVGAVLTILLCAGGVALAQSLPHHVQFANWQAVATLAFLVILLPAHEAVHALGLRCFAGVRRHDIRFGVIWRALMPYCHCTALISVNAYRRMALLPLWVTGGLSLALLLVVPAECFGALAGVAVAACVGDVWMVIKLRRFSDPLLVLDHPSEIGCDVFSITAEPVAAQDRDSGTASGNCGVTEGPPGDLI